MKVDTSPPSSSQTVERPVIVSSSMPSGAVNYQSLLAAEGAEDSRHALGDGRVGDADELAGGVGGVCERAEYVEDGADAYFAAGAGGEAHGGMEALGEHEAEADILHAPGDGFGGEGYVDSERFEDVG